MVVRSLRLKDGVADRLSWSGPRDPVSYTCSSCGNTIDFREAPLRLMGRRNAVFCEPCVALCFETVIQA